MQNGNWGHCKNCRYFGSPAAIPLGAEESRCLHPALSKFQLRIYGSNGCSSWELRAGLKPEVEAIPGTIRPPAPSQHVGEVSDR